MSPAITLSRTNLSGVWPALVTPWTDDDRLDEQRFRREIQAYAGTGVAGVYTGGTTGEFYAQDDATFERITAVACEEAHGLGVPIQIGCTALSTRIARDRIHTAVTHGADAIQIALPFWLALSNDEVRDFFEVIATAADGTPLVLYHTSRAKRRLSAELLQELAERHPTLIGMKDTAASTDELREMLRCVPDFAVLTAERDLLTKVQAGARGTCSSAALLNAPLVVRLYELCAAGHFDDAQPLQDALERYFRELLIPMVRDERLLDSAVDRVQRIAGGVDVGLRCQGPYRSAGEAHVERLRQWCRTHAPVLLPLSVGDAESTARAEPRA